MNSIEIDGRKIGREYPPFIIAEAGINHNGDLDMAKKMVLAAKNAEVDAVKFQTFYAEDIIQDRSLMYTYQSQGEEITEPILDMFKRCEFTTNEWKELKKYCDDVGIMFLSTPGNISDLEMLLSLKVSAIKVGSDDFVNIPLIRRYSKEPIPLLLSCGMATEEEIDYSLRVCGLESGKDICLLLCTSQYPTPPEDVNIMKLSSLREKYPQLVLGFSDHTIGSVAAIMAVAHGACVFEKHFTLDHNFVGPDHWFSEEPSELKKWVNDIRTAYSMLGTPCLQPTEKERMARKEYHRSITVVQDINVGDELTESNLCMRRPGEGIPANKWDEVVGKISLRNIKRGTQLSYDDFK